MGSLGLPDAVHDRLSLRNPHYRDTALSLAPVFWTPYYSGLPFSPGLPFSLGATQLLPLEEITRITVPARIPVRAALLFSHSVNPHVHLNAAQMEIRIWFGAKPPMSHSILCTRLLWVAPSWTCCATTDLGDVLNAAPSSATPVTIPIMIRITNLPSAGWGNRNRENQVTANICVVLGKCTDTVVQLLSMPGQPAQSGRYVQCCCFCMICMISPNVMRMLSCAEIRRDRGVSLSDFGRQSRENLCNPLRRRGRP